MAEQEEHAGTYKSWPAFYYQQGEYIEALAARIEQLEKRQRETEALIPPIPHSTAA